MIWKRTQRQGPAMPRLLGSGVASPTQARVCLPHARLTLLPKGRAPPASVQGVNSGQPGDLWHTTQQGREVPAEGTGLQRLRDFRTMSARAQKLRFGTFRQTRLRPRHSPRGLALKGPVGCPARELWCQGTEHPGQRAEQQWPEAGVPPARSALFVSSWEVPSREHPKTLGQRGHLARRRSGILLSGVTRLKP